MPLIDVNLSGQLSPTCRLCQRQYHMQRTRNGHFCVSWKGIWQSPRKGSSEGLGTPFWSSLQISKLLLPDAEVINCLNIF